MKLFTCFVHKNSNRNALATEFLFKEKHVITPEDSILVVSVNPSFPLPEPETVVPGFVEKLEPVEAKTKNNDKKHFFYYRFDPAEFLFEFSAKFKKYEQEFIAFKKCLKENNFEKAKFLISDMRNGNEFIFSVFYNNGYYEVYRNHFPENVRTLLKHIKTVHKNILLYVEELTSNLNLY